MSNDNGSLEPPAPVTPVTPEPEPRAQSTPSGTRSRKWLTPALALVAVLAVGLVGGVLIGHATAPAARASGFSRGANGAPGGARAGAARFAAGGFTSGTIVSISGTTLVIKAPDGTHKTVTASSTTKVSKTTSTTVSALTAGQKVTVIGPSGANGDITATAISEGTPLRGIGSRPGAANG